MCFCCLLDRSAAQHNVCLEYACNLNYIMKLIIDVDTGIDDAQAIMMALSANSRAEVLAITCVDGNTILENVCTNTLRVLEACDCLQVCKL